MLIVTIPNWAKFNPRTDRANYTWFRLQNDFFHDQAVFGLSDSQRCLYLFFLCEASKKNSETVKLIVGYVAAMLGKKESEILKDFQRLADVGVVTSESRHDDGKEPSNSLATYERTNDTNGHIREPAVHPLVEIWNKNSGSLPKIQKCQGSRKTKAEARWRENPDSTYWESVVRRLAASPFCQGENNSGWRATFDFLIRPDTATKAFEGNYDRRTSGINTKPVDLESL